MYCQRKLIYLFVYDTELIFVYLEMCVSRQYKLYIVFFCQYIIFWIVGNRLLK